MGLFSGLFGGGGASQQSQSTSSSTGYGFSSSLSDSLSRSISQGTASSLSGSSGLSGSQQRIAFEDLFRELYGGATGATQKAAGLVPQLQGQAASLFNAGTGFLDTLQNQAGGVADEQVAQLGSDLQRFYQEQIDPSIVGRGVATGTLGGSRGEVARGIASRGLFEEFARGSTNIRAADLARRSQAAQAGLGALPSLLNVAQGGATAGLTPYSALSQILGGPTALTSSFGEQTSFGQSESQQTSESIAQSIARALSEQFSSSTSQSTSSGVNKPEGFGRALILTALPAFLGG